MKETIILGRDNENSVFLLEEGSPLTSLVGITQVLLIVDDVTIDSLGNGVGLFDLTGAENWRPGDPKPVIKFTLGTSGLLTEGIYRGCRIITFDTSNPNGLEWTRDLVIEVKA
jgi:hypothetical protein